MEPLLATILWLVLTLLRIYLWILIATVVLSWLVAFNVVNTRNPVVRQIDDILNRLTEPLLRPIRQALPNLGGLDLSPLVLALGIMFLERLIINYVPALIY